MSRNFFRSVVEKPQSCTCGGARPRRDRQRLLTAPLLIDKTYGPPKPLIYKDFFQAGRPIGYAYHNDRNKRLDFCEKILHTPPMKIKKKILTKWAFRLYVVYSVTADLIVIGGIVYIIFF